MRRFEPQRPPSALTALVLALAAALPGPGCASSRRADEADAPYPVLEGADFGGMQNVSQCGHVWVGSRPAAADLELAVRRGVELVVDVTAPAGAQRLELAQAADELGLEYVAIGGDSATLDDADVDVFLDALARAESSPVLVFCDNGGRSAQLLAIFRVLRDGVPLQAALEDARKGGMKPGDDEEFVRRQVDRLGA